MNLNSLIKIFLCFIVASSLQAQMQTAHWYFGKYAGLDFSSGSPVMVTDGQINTKEGCTSISDEYGNLLFYTDGRTVYDASHNIMENGTGLRGDVSSTSSAVVLPVPDDCNLYYVFTIDVGEYESHPWRPDRGMEYNIVDMSLNGGLGAVVEKNIEIPINGIQQGYERLAAISNADRTGYWVLTYFEENFYAFAVTSEGVNLNPVVSPTSGIYTPDPITDIGYLKGSPDGSKMAMGVTMENCADQYLLLYDFDNAMGVVSNEVALHQSDPDLEPGRDFYGVEFSANSKVLYATSSIWCSGQNLYEFEIWQYNLEASNVAGSKYVIDNTYYGALQRGLDGKIYNSNFRAFADLDQGTATAMYIGVIENPDTVYNPITGEVPVYNPQGVNMGTNLNHFPMGGLPTFLNHYFRIAITVNGLSIKEEHQYCSGELLDFGYCHQGGAIESIHWDFGDGSASTEFYPQHAYNTTGVHTITLTLVVDGEEYIRTFDITITGPPNIDNALLETCDTGEAQTFHFSDALPQINPTNTDAEITFHETEAEAHENQNPLQDTLITNTTTMVYVRAEDSNGCYVVRTLELVIHPLPSLDVQTPVETCYGTSASLSVNTEAGNMVSWYASHNGTVPVFTGNPFETPELLETTSYWVETVNDYGCVSERLEVTVNVPTENIPLFTLNQIYCLDAMANPLPSVSDNGISGSWSPSIVDTSVLGTQTHVFTTDVTECGDAMQISMVFEVRDIRTPEFNLDTEYLLGETPQPLPDVSINGISGIWYPATISQTDTYVFMPFEDQCAESVSVEIKVIKYPKFFTPNQDSYNDYWNIWDFTQEHQAEILIFDRYGKLLKQLFPPGQGWDGTYNGNNMPTNDYWFKVLYQVPELNGSYITKEFRAHFTLKR